MVTTQKPPSLIHATTFIARGAIVAGDVHLEKETSVWFNAVLRADTEHLTIKAGTNIQDGCILHADPGYPLIIAENVTVGHGAIIHGARIGQNSLIGIRAVLLNGAVVGENSIVAAGSLIPEGKAFPPGSLIMGTPAKAVRKLTDKEIERNRTAAKDYIEKARACKQQQE